MKPEAKFFEAIESTVFNKSHREALSTKLDAIHRSVTQAKLNYSDLELAKTRAAFIKNKTLDNLDKYLIEFESNFTKKGGKVIWAQDKDEALSEILKLIEKKGAKKILKNRSLLFEEIELNKVLEEKKITSSETDIGNYIQSLAAENSYHPVFPTLHQNSDTLTTILKEKHELNIHAGAQDMVNVILAEIKEQLSAADVALFGVDFLVADSGMLAVFENEANTAQLSSLPKTQIALAGIEAIIPGINEVDLFMHLYSSHSTGEFANAYTHLISGPKQNDENDGPEELVVVLIDNGRSDVLAQTNQRSAMACIKCGACFNVCPVYKNIGGHAYQAVYNGPIGSIITPLMLGMNEYKYLSFASSSSSETLAVCPVKIDIPKLLQNNRTASVKLAPPNKTEKLSLFFWKTAMLKRSNMDKGGAKLKNFMLRQFFKKSWGERREIPNVAQKSFNQIWRERKGIK